MTGKVTPQFRFQRPIESFHDGSLDVLIFRRKVMNFVTFQPLLKSAIEEFRTFIRLQMFRKAVWDRFKSIHERCSRLVFDGDYPCLLGKHVDAGQEKFGSLIVSTQPGHVDQIGLPLLMRTSDDGLSPRKLVTNGFVKSINILTTQPCSGSFRVDFRSLCQWSNASETPDAFDVVIGGRQPFLLLPHVGMKVAWDVHLFMRLIPTS